LATGKIRAADLKPPDINSVIPRIVKNDKTQPIEAPVEVEGAKRQPKTKGEEKTQAQTVETPVFPAKAKINAYGFIHLSQRVLEAMGLKKKTEYPVKILGYKDGVLTIGLELATTV
jgi:hypothetical protein